MLDVRILAGADLPFKELHSLLMVDDLAADVSEIEFDACKLLPAMAAAKGGH
ncbi:MULTISPECIES: hypothetical protein [unclassified Mesorhizobium]|uniref:hypothetical protein n=1 Tax=unclassified Mesorhizobium TaxID=325217 RepID=UPI001FEFEA0B|nr:MULTISPECIES: hypothetical protein [unclassified Mesorhizobium]